MIEEGKSKVLLIAAAAICLAMVPSAQAADITWTGAVSEFWWETGNWSGDANFYSDGDDVTINADGNAIRMNPNQHGDANTSSAPIYPNSITVDTTGGDLEWEWGWGEWHCRPDAHDVSWVMSSKLLS